MRFFSKIPEGQAIVLNGGVYRQVEIAVRDGKIYAKHGGGWVRLSKGGATSHQRVRWHEIDTPNGIWRETGVYVEYEGE